MYGQLIPESLTGRRPARAPPPAAARRAGAGIPAQFEPIPVPGRARGAEMGRAGLRAPKGLTTATRAPAAPARRAAPPATGLLVATTSCMPLSQGQGAGVKGLQLSV